LVVGEALSDQRTRPPHDPPVAVVVLVVAVIIERIALMASVEPWPADAVNRDATRAGAAVLMGRDLSPAGSLTIFVSNEIKYLK
jgi:hypothetical protein